MARAQLATIVIAVVAAVLGSVATAHGASGYADVRVAARLVEEGRFEFAVQQRLDDGSWGARVLPQRRFFPAEPGHDRWLFATPVTVSAPAFEVEVRVAARRVVRGRERCRVPWRLRSARRRLLGRRAGQSTPPGGTFSAIAAGSRHTCATRSDGSVTCWGQDERGQSSPPPGSFQELAGGGADTCGVRDDGTVACWGRDDFGETLPPADAFTSVTLGIWHACGLKTDGTVSCWGYDGTGESTPPAGTFTAVSAGSLHTCGIRTDGTVACWGSITRSSRGLALEPLHPSPQARSTPAGSGRTAPLRAGVTTRMERSRRPPAPSRHSAQARTTPAGVRTDGSVTCRGRDLTAEDSSTARQAARSRASRRAEAARGQRRAEPDCHDHRPQRLTSGHAVSGYHAISGYRVVLEGGDHRHHDAGTH